MKAGTYYIGDPCYVFDEHWTEVLKLTDYFRKDELYGHEIASGFVQSDGVYWDNEGNPYFVDSGTIAILPVKLLDIDSTRDAELGNTFTFWEDFDVKIKEGVFEFGNIKIEA
jgi:hypothetical protein